MATTPLGPVQTTTLYAAVKGSGGLLRGVGAVSVDGPDADKVYTVTFNVDVSLGAFNATVDTGDGSYPYFATAELAGDGDGTAVKVAVWNANGQPRKAPFFLTVTTVYGNQNMNPAS